MSVFPKIIKKQRLLILSSCISCILCGFVNPMITKTLFSSVSTRFISFQTLMYCIAGMISSRVWKNVQISMMKNYFKFEIVESILLTVSTLYFMLHWNVLAFFIYNLMYGVIVSEWIGMCQSSFYSFLFPNPQEKIDVGNVSEFYTSGCMIIGNLLAMVFTPSIKVALIFFAISDLFRTFALVSTYCFKFKSYIWEQVKLSKATA